MDFRILGPLEVQDGDRTLALDSRDQRTLLAHLVLRAGEVVPTDVHASELREALGDSRLQEAPGGYVLEAEAEEIDSRRFERLLEEGRRLRLDGDPTAAAERLSEAMLLWRGAPLGDVAGEEFAQAEVVRLAELRLIALEERFDAQLALGADGGLLPDLEDLVRDHPHRERLVGQLMLALYRVGREDEALSVYRRGRRSMAESLGVEPGPHLRDLERAILTHDPSLTVPKPEPIVALARSGTALIIIGAALLAAIVVLIIIAVAQDPMAVRPTT